MEVAKDVQDRNKKGADLVSTSFWLQSFSHFLEISGFSTRNVNEDDSTKIHVPHLSVFVGSGASLNYCSQYFVSSCLVAQPFFLRHISMDTSRPFQPSEKFLEATVTLKKFIEIH